MLAAQVTGVALLRLADAEVLPFDYEAYGRQILEYIGEIEKQATDGVGREREDDRFRRPAGRGGGVREGRRRRLRARGEALLAAAGARDRRRRSPR